MATAAALSYPNRAKQLFGLRKIVVAHDFSDAADKAMADAMALARAFQSEIAIAHINGPESVVIAIDSEGARHNPICARMEDLRRRVALAGYRCKEILRSGDVAAGLFEIRDQEQPDLILLGAYGNGSQSRNTLGSTAEQLLRTIACPVMIYGPKVTKGLFQDDQPRTILLPIELPCHLHDLAFAIKLAKLFKARLEVVHVVDMSRTVSMPDAYQHQQCACDDLVAGIRQHHVDVTGSLVFGTPDAVILEWSREHAASLILIPLERRGRLSSRQSDNVAVSVIRSAEVPVLTYRIG